MDKSFYHEKQNQKKVYTPDQVINPPPLPLFLISPPPNSPFSLSHSLSLTHTHTHTHTPPRPSPPLVDVEKLPQIDE